MQLPQIDDRSTPLGQKLQHLNVGEVRLSRHQRLLYSTDASLYQVEPLAVVIPQTIEQIETLLKFCTQNQTPILPRGGGTSLAGQCTSPGIVLDLSPHFRQITDIDIPNRRCKAAPGVVLDELNRQLINTKLFFAPDPATVAQATIGGCIGNNAAGSRSIRYGRTSENIAALQIMLTTGEQLWLGPGAGRKNTTALRLAKAVAQIVTINTDLIRSRFPKLVRRNAGYGLDLILNQLDAGIPIEDLDLTGLLCGSEGTLAITIAAELKLHPLPLSRALAIATFDSVDAAIAAVPSILKLSPSAIELIDDVVLDAARKNAECNPYVALLPTPNSQPPNAALFIEFQNETSADESTEKFNQLRALLPHTAMHVYQDAASMASAWTLRKYAEALLHGLSSTHKPVTFVEDNSVPIENLARFVKEFRTIVEAHGTHAAFYAHASVGVLHVRPMIDLRTAKGLEMMQSISIKIADLARDCGGVMSGEHGDGKVRGPLLERFYGPELMSAFQQIKQVFDPQNLLNPGNIVGAGPIESITQNLRVQQEHPTRTETYFDYEDQEGFHSAVEMCNGAGFCRKTQGGTMCPSYRATLDERHSTRGRGNALRLAITGQTQSTWNEPETEQTLNLCLSCKACKTECPSNVDISRLKAEYTAQKFKTTGIPISARVLGHIRIFNRLGSIAPTFSNWMLKQKLIRWIAQTFLKIAPQRNLPPLGPSLFRWFKKRNRPENNATKVVLFGDCFTAYNEPHIGQSAVQVLEKLGYQVMLPKVGCCGRSMISVGLLQDAIRSADRVIEILKPYVNDPNVSAIVVCEPSCLSAIKDDWMQLKLNAPLDLRRKICDRAFLVEDFIEKKWNSHPTCTDQTQFTHPIILHGHCHQKALWGDQTSSAILRRLSNDVTVIPSGCCGMAGSFGYAKDKYDLSIKIGELSVFPPIRAAGKDAIIVAPGTSCRHQIKDGTGREALHPIQVIANLLGI